MNILPMAAGWAMLVAILEVLTFGFLLSNDIISRTFQVLFFGPLVGGGALLRYARDAWDVPIPSTPFGGFPGWLSRLLFLMNWLFYCFLGTLLLVLRERRARLRG